MCDETHTSAKCEPPSRLISVFVTQPVVNSRPVFSLVTPTISLTLPVCILPHLRLPTHYYAHSRISSFLVSGAGIVWKRRPLHYYRHQCAKKARRLPKCEHGTVIDVMLRLAISLSQRLHTFSNQLCIFAHSQSDYYHSTMVRLRWEKSRLHSLAEQEVLQIIGQINGDGNCKCLAAIRMLILADFFAFLI